MTCIVGFIDKGNVYIGGDSAASTEFIIRTRKTPKVFINGEFIFGTSGSFRMSDLIRYSFNPPRYIEDVHGDVLRYMCTDFVNSLRNCLTSGGFAKVSCNEESGGFFLVGFKGKLFTIENDYQVEECVDQYTSVGSGESYALGSLFSSTKETPQEKIEEALKCAEYFNPFVRSPFTILKM